MKRRTFLRSMGVGAMAAASQVAHPTVSLAQSKPVQWRMVTAWPESMPILQTGVERFAKQVTRMSGGRMKIKVFAANQLVKSLEVFNAVSRGEVACGHSAAYYWAKNIPAAQWFTTVPFGLKYQDMNTWYYAGGGRELWEEVYAPFGVVPMLAGNTGIQMGGWFNRTIKTELDFNGLRMRIPGLGGKVVAKLGAEVLLLPADEIVAALKSGKINAAEWIGPYHDSIMGFPRIARYYYAPGWHEPGTAFEMIFNAKALAKLPVGLKMILEAAAAKLNQEIFSEFEHQNRIALLKIAQERKVQLRLFPHNVLRTLERLSSSVLEEEAAKDPVAHKVNEAFLSFKSNMRKLSLLRGANIRI